MVNYIFMAIALWTTFIYLNIMLTHYINQKAGGGFRGSKDELITDAKVRLLLLTVMAFSWSQVLIW